MLNLFSCECLKASKHQRRGRGRKEEFEDEEEEEEKSLSPPKSTPQSSHQTVKKKQKKTPHGAGERCLKRGMAAVVIDDQNDEKDMEKFEEPKKKSIELIFLI